MSGISYRLEGLEPDNLLAFLALLGLLRTLETDDRQRANDKLRARAAWDVDMPPLRPRLFLAHNITLDEIAERAARGLDALASGYEFGGQRDLNYQRLECRTLLERSVRAAGRNSREHVDLISALMSDGAVKDEKKELIDPTPLCLMFGQGHQHFLDRLASIPRESAPPPRGKGRKAIVVSAAQCLREALFHPWHRDDPSFSFRWDPEEDVRHALMAGDPTDVSYKPGTQHGANRLAAIALSVLTLVPQMRGQRARASVVGGEFGPDGFSFAWPIWREPTTLSSIRALLGHPCLRRPEALTHLDVDHVLVAQRISVGKFMNFSRARPVAKT